MTDIKKLEYFGDKCNRYLFKWYIENENKFDSMQNMIRPYRLEDRTEQVAKLNLDPELEKFYSSFDGWKVEWKVKPEFGVDLEGTINILTLEQVLYGDKYFNPDEYPVMQNFTLLDIFYNEAAIGFYVDKPEDGLYFYDFEADPEKLNLDFHGYLEMIKYTRGFAYWQKITFTPPTKIVKRILEVSKIFPGITQEGFFELYDKLRIDKKQKP